MAGTSVPKTSEILGMALARFLEEDHQLMEYGVKEEALSHRLGCYLLDLLPEYTVDCEYDKYGAEMKKGAYGKGIRPDIIVHKRGNQENNLMAIEIKKRSWPSAWDVRKLKRLTSKRRSKYTYKYSLGVFIGFGSADSDVRLEWFEKGRQVELPGELVGEVIE